MALSTGQVQLRDEDRATLLSWTQSLVGAGGLSMRAKVVLTAANGDETSAISRRLGVSRPRWTDAATARSPPFPLRSTAANLPALREDGR